MSIGLDHLVRHGRCCIRWHVLQAKACIFQNSTVMPSAHPRKKCSRCPSQVSSMAHHCRISLRRALLPNSRSLYRVLQIKKLRVSGAYELRSKNSAINQMSEQEFYRCQTTERSERITINGIGSYPIPIRPQSNTHFPCQNKTS